jgi:hypothetical protein
MRVKVETTAMNKLSVKIVVRWPMTVNPITNMTSEGLTEPLVACPKVRIKIMVITMVANTTTVAPKLRAKSFWMEEWNNIVKLEKTQL